MKNSATFALAALLALACTCACDKAGVKAQYPGLDKVSYTEYTKLIPNPERGFYSPVDFVSVTENPVNANRITASRNLGRTLYLLEFYLTNYMESDIADDYLDLVEKNFKALRENGAKALVRFAYKNGYSAMDHPWDASEEWVLRHIEQLAPILRENSDVILVVQAGFVGSWGEWYYTDHFVQGPKSEEDYQPRKHVLDALLAALPENRQVEVRTPAFKMKIYGYALADTLTVANAHDGSIKSRVGGHNDCFGASADDQGTFHGQSERDYWNAETRYTIMGGETCAVSKYCHCENTLKDMEDQHWTYINSAYHGQVLARWKTEDCFNEIELRLGYRFVLQDSWYSPSIAEDGTFRAVVNIKNTGFAAPMNPRLAEFILLDADGKVVSTYPIDSDPRFWFENQTVTLDQTFKVPAGTKGPVDLCLNLPDPEPRLKSNPRFSIRLANEDVWDEATGFNKLYTIDY